MNNCFKLIQLDGKLKKKKPNELSFPKQKYRNKEYKRNKLLIFVLSKYYMYSVDQSLDVHSGFLYKSLYCISYNHIICFEHLCKKWTVLNAYFKVDISLWLYIEVSYILYGNHLFNYEKRVYDIELIYCALYHGKSYWLHWSACYLYE